MSDPPELELQGVLNYCLWVLESKLNSSGRTEPFLTSEPSLQPHGLFFKYVCVHTQSKKNEILKTGLTVTTPSLGSVFLA